MALKGNLKDFSLTQLLNLIRLARKTGDLIVEESGGPLHVFCQDGRLTGLARDGRKTPLGEVILKAGRLTEEELKLARSGMALNSDKELALRLMDLGVLSREDVIQVVSQQMLETLYPFFSASKGSFNFDPDARPPEDDITIAMELESVILEGGRRTREAGRLQEVIPSLDIVPRLAPQQDAKMRSINLSVDQWKVISFINGRNTMKQIGDYAGLSEFLSRRVFQELVTAGLVEFGEAAKRQSAGRGGAPEANAAKSKAVTPVAPGQPVVSRNILMRLIDRVRRL
jgi:hypothetical protein